MPNFALAFRRKGDGGRAGNTLNKRRSEKVQLTKVKDLAVSKIVPNFAEPFRTTGRRQENIEKNYNRKTK